MGKGEIARLSHFSFSYSAFKTLVLQTHKNRLVWERIKDPTRKGNRKQQRTKIRPKINFQNVENINGKVKMLEIRIFSISLAGNGVNEDFQLFYFSKNGLISYVYHCYKTTALFGKEVFTCHILYFDIYLAT